MNHSKDMRGDIRDEEADDPSDPVERAPGRGVWAAVRRMLTSRAAAATPRPCSSTEEIYRTHWEFVWRKLRKRGVEPGAIEDAHQKVFLTVEEQSRNGELPRNPEAMLTTISSNATLNHRRDRKRQGRFAGEVDTDAVPASGPDAEQRLINAERARIVETVLAAMPEEERMLIQRLDLDGLTHKVVAEGLGLPVGTVKTRHRAARATFREMATRLYPNVKLGGGR